ncbi:MAG: thioredoxin family protein [Campylobacterota bacterium]|nr:thioredoxin family protein [Campylobacterota bacterium]
MSRLLLLVVLFFSISNGDELNKFTNLDLAIKEAKVEKKDILIIFHGKQCHYCDKMKKNTLTDNEVIKFYK